MSVFDRYILKNLMATTLVITMVLAAILFLTQSLRFLELIISVGATGGAFWALTMLALPRFFEIILPIALMISILFIYSRMTTESEITVMRTAGSSPASLARPALIVAGLTTVFLWVMTSWAAPVSLSKMQKMRQVIKAEYSSFYLREGVFNNIRPGLTIFIRDRLPGGDLLGILMHDKRQQNTPPVTVMAKRGQIISDDFGQKVIVYDGSRQSIDPETKALQKLDFDRYTIDLPEEAGTPRQRWMEPDERTLWHLLNPDPDNKRDMRSREAFFIEAHRRIVSPLLAMTFSLIALSAILLGPLSRRGQNRRIFLAIFLVVLIQGLYLGVFNMARQSHVGLYLMYFLVISPILGGLFSLSSFSERFRRRILFMMARGSKESPS